MKAIRVAKPLELQIVEVEKPQVQAEDDVLVKVLAGGICGTDAGIFKGTNAMVTYPRVLGHEFAGVVEAIGEGVKGIAVGDRVAVDPVVSCGECYACTHGRHNVCEKLEVMGVHREGGFAEYLLTKEKNCYKTSMDMPCETLCLVEPFSIGAEVNWRGRIHAGDTVLIIGCGAIGLTVLQIAKMNGAKVIASDLIQERVQRALDMGADAAVNASTQDVEAAVMAFTDGSGVNVAVDAACKAETGTLNQALKLASQAGRVVSLTTNGTLVPVDPSVITKKELDLCGSRLSNYKFPDVIRWAEEGKIRLEEIRSHVFHYTEIEKALRMFSENQAETCKLVITFDE